MTKSVRRSTSLAPRAPTAGAVRGRVYSPGKLIGLLLLCGVWGCGEPLPRPASPRVEQGRETWACGFPPAAVDAQIQDATVLLRVLVKRNGAPAEIQILSATSPLFIEHTRQCALARYYEPAYDIHNRRAEGWTVPFRIRYLADPSAAPN